MRKHFLRIAGLFFATVVSAAFFCGCEGGSPTRRKEVSKGVDVMELESGLQDMKKSLASFAAAERAVPGTRKRGKDPFVSLIVPEVIEPAVISEDDGIEKPAEPPVEEPEAPSAPRFTVSGIVYGKTPLALIEGAVFAEGDSIGEYRIYRIEKDSILVEYRDTVFTLPSPFGGGGRD